MNLSHRTNQKGQMALEMILIMVLLTGFTMFVTSQFKSNEILAGILSKPWRSIAGMIENGDWKDPKDSMNSHPGNIHNHVSTKGEDE